MFFTKSIWESNLGPHAERRTSVNYTTKVIKHKGGKAKLDYLSIDSPSRHLFIRTRIYVINTSYRHINLELFIPSEIYFHL